MSNDALNSLLREYEQKKLDAELDLEKRKQTLYKLIPRLEEIDSELSKLGISTAKNILNNVSEPNSVDNLKLKIANLKKEKEAKKKQKSLEVKELRVTPNIEEHDFEFKAKNARKFLTDGNKVKITVRFRGREVNNSKAGEIVLNNFIEKLEDIATVEKQPKLEGRNMFTILAKKA